MAVYQRDLFTSLVNQLQLDPSVKKYFQNGSLLELIIHDRSKLWTLHVKLNSILPYKAFQQFMHQLHDLLKSESIRMFIYVDQPKLTGSLVKDYWPWVIRHCGLSTLMARQLVKDGQLKITDNDIALKTTDEALKAFLVDGALIQIEDMYHQLGFPTFKIRVPGSKSGRKLPAELTTFGIKKVTSDIKLARDAVAALDADESK